MHDQLANDAINPAMICVHARIDARDAICAATSPRHQANQLKFATVVVHHWTTGIALYINIKAFIYYYI